MINREEILAEVRRIVLSVVKDLPVRVYLFGSWARGEERATSDVDIAVESDKLLAAETLYRIRHELEESTVPYRVDVMDLLQADAMIAEIVRKEGVLWKG